MPPRPSPSASNPTHNLTAAFLYLRTASTAVTNLAAQIESTKAYIQYDSQLWYYSEHTAYRAQLETEMRDFQMWETRLVEAGVGVVNWAAKVRMGRWLPGEILGMIGERLQKDDMVLPEVW